MFISLKLTDGVSIGLCAVHPLYTSTPAVLCTVGVFIRKNVWHKFHQAIILQKNTLRLQYFLFLWMYEYMFIFSFAYLYTCPFIHAYKSITSSVTILFFYHFSKPSPLHFPLFLFKRLHLKSAQKSNKKTVCRQDKQFLVFCFTQSQFSTIFVSKHYGQQFIL